MKNSIKVQEKEKKQSKNTVFDVIFYILSSILVIFAIISFEEAIRCFITKENSIFALNFVKNVLFLMISAFIYYFLTRLQEKNKLECKQWLKIFTVLYVFIVFNVLNFFDLYKFIIVEYIAFFISGALFAIFGVSFYYNYLKNENNTVKAKASMVVIFSVAISLAFVIFIEILWYFVDFLAGKDVKMLKTVIFDIVFALIGSIIMNTFFYTSLNKSKKFINACLIDVKK